MSKQEFPIPAVLCPHCGYAMTECTVVHGHNQRPASGDWSVCFGCGEVLRFDDELKLRALTAHELKELKRDRKAWQVVDDAQRLIRKRGPLAQGSRA